MLQASGILPSSSIRPSVHPSTFSNDISFETMGPIIFIVHIWHGESGNGHFLLFYWGYLNLST